MADEKLRVVSGGGIKERVREGRGGATTVVVDVFQIINQCQML